MDLTFSFVFQSHWQMVPSSWPVMMYLSKQVQPATTAFEPPLLVMVTTGVSDSMQHQSVSRRFRSTHIILTSAIHITVDGVDSDRAGEAHTLLSNAQHHGIILTEFNALDSSLELPCLQTATSLNLPKLATIVSRTSNEQCRVG